MDRRSLYALDQVLAKYLEKDNMIKVLKSAIDEDYGSVMHGGQIMQQAQSSFKDQEDQVLKKPSEQRDFNNRIKNEDALFKQLAFGSILDQKNQAIIESRESTHLQRGEVIVESNNFERAYMKQLGHDAT